MYCISLRYLFIVSSCMAFSFTDEVTPHDERYCSENNGAIDQLAILSVLLLSAKSVSYRPNSLFSSRKSFWNVVSSIYQFLSIFVVRYCCMVNP